MVSSEKITLSKVSDSRVFDLWNGNSGSGGDSGTVLLFLYPPITRVASLIAEVGGGSSNVREVWKLRFKRGATIVCRPITGGSKVVGTIRKKTQVD
ncbi:hypothetical protein L1987_87708 [Smallanthus sonchifolius]|nr:hypothetical protein L1987_87700 [Smallanthus sonchifolius]KAI3670711.1 hypothetical protein L1987_87705 [Smallanthus sonchifolius]KAI3670714.1 hypothetical protein L1987_87708 [Smallanthus sonchifolius]